MKHTIKKTKNIALGLSSLFMMGATQTILAAAVADNPTEIKFLGKEKSQPLFQLNINNNEKETFVVVIKNNAAVKYIQEKSVALTSAVHIAWI